MGIISVLKQAPSGHLNNCSMFWHLCMLAPFFSTGGCSLNYVHNLKCEKLTNWANNIILTYPGMTVITIVDLMDTVLALLKNMTCY